MYAASDDNYGLVARSTNSHAVDAMDVGSGVGIYASSFSGNAGYFYGPVVITNTLTVGSTMYSSDRNLKTDFFAVDGHALLERVSSMPIGTWKYKSDSNLRHLGPMAQDFHAAFGLNGNDDTHINEVDAIGVSLAAVQELNRQLKLQNAQIAKLTIDNAAEVAELRAQLADQAKAVADIRRQDNAIQSMLLALQADGRVAQR